MPKMKTHSGSKKRVKVTGSGKLVRRHAFRGHFLSKKRGSRKRNYSKTHDFSASDQQNVKNSMGM